MSKQGNRPCIIQGCDLVTPPNSKLPICENCRATINRWEYRRAAEIDHRKQFLTKSSNRMGEVSGGKRRGKR